MDVDLTDASHTEEAQPLVSPEVSFAIEAVRQASRLARSVQLTTAKGVLTKRDRSPVTVADFAVQALIAGRLQESFPADPLVAEEDSRPLREEADGPDLLRQVTRLVQRHRPEADPKQICEWIDQGTAEVAQRFWTLDPIDGTKGFLRGNQYATALALIENGEIQVAVLGCPNIGELTEKQASPAELVVACRGQGAWSTQLRQGGPLRRLRVSSSTLSAKARLVRSVEEGHTDSARLKQFSKLFGAVRSPILMDSQVKYVFLAEGRADLLLRLPSQSQPDQHEKIWDHAAGWLVLKEAGGEVTDLLGQDLDFGRGRTLAQNVGLLASNGHLHIAALRALRKITPGQGTSATGAPVTGS